MRKIHQSIQRNIGRGCAVISMPLLLPCTLASISFSALANDAASEDAHFSLEEVVVTAQRRSQNLQDVPIAISAKSGDNLKDLGVSDLYGLTSLAPNLDISHSQGKVKIFIRGIGKSVDIVGGEGAVALHQDGVVISYPGAQSTAFFDIERVEVLRGPQGTLYGRNATGGAVNVITRGPSEDFQFDARVNVGNNNSREFELAVGGSLVEDKLLGRLAVVNIDRDGFGKNIFDGSDIDDRSEYALRGKLKWLATDNLTLDFSYDYWAADDAAGVVHTFGSAFGELQGVVDGGIADPNYRDISSEADSVRDNETSGASLRIEYVINDEWTLMSLSGYRDVDGKQRSQFDGTDAPGWPVSRIEKGHHLSEEIQLNWDTDSINAVFGLYYFENTVFNSNTVPFQFAVNGPTDLFDEKGTAETTAWAGFGSLTWAATENLNLTAGLRYSDEERHSYGSFQIRIIPFGVDAFIPQDRTKSYDAWTPRFSVDYSLGENSMIYATVSKGFKSGQILPGNQSPPIDPEFVWNYEAGLKSVLLDGRLKTNLTAFFYDYTDLQVSQLEGVRFTINNAAEAEVRGFEAEITYLLSESTQLELVYGYLDGEFTEFLTEDPLFPELGVLNLGGNPLVAAPENMFTLSASHSVSTAAGNIDVMGAWRWRDDAFFDPFKREAASQEAYSTVSMRATYTPHEHNWTVSLWGNNIFDKEAITTSSVSLASGGYPVNGSVNDPRTFGLEFNYKM